MHRPRAVLIHGMLGFRHFLWREYFHGVRRLLEDMGFYVITPKLHWGGSIKKRATALARQLETKPGPLHLIAHSMGGIDARCYIAYMGGHTKVASLTTLASPHRGTPAAEYIMSGWSLFRLLPSMVNLTPDAMRIFNKETPDHLEVAYRSYSAARPIHEQPWLVRRYGRIIQAAAGDNDSQVCVSSARWGRHVRTLCADHFELIGMNIWLNPFRRRQHFDHLPLYREIADWIRQYERNSGQPVKPVK